MSIKREMVDIKYTCENANCNCRQSGFKNSFMEGVLYDNFFYKKQPYCSFCGREMLCGIIVPKKEA